MRQTERDAFAGAVQRKEGDDFLADAIFGLARDGLTLFAERAARLHDGEMRGARPFPYLGDRKFDARGEAPARVAFATPADDLATQHHVGGAREFSNGNREKLRGESRGNAPHPPQHESQTKHLRGYHSSRGGSKNM